MTDWNKDPGIDSTTPPDPLGSSPKFWKTYDKYHSMWHDSKLYDPDAYSPWMPFEHKEYKFKELPYGPLKHDIAYLMQNDHPTLVVAGDTVVKEMLEGSVYGQIKIYKNPYMPKGVAYLVSKGSVLGINL